MFRVAHSTGRAAEMDQHGGFVEIVSPPRQDREVVEIAMGHRFHGAVEASYVRGDLLNERRELLNEWGSYCLGQDTIEDEDQKVVQLRRAQ